MRLKNAHVLTASLVLAYNALVDVFGAPDDGRVDETLDDAGHIELGTRLEWQLECGCAPALIFGVEGVAVDRLMRCDDFL